MYGIYVTDVSGGLVNLGAFATTNIIPYHGIRYKISTLKKRLES